MLFAIWLPLNAATDLYFFVPSWKKVHWLGRALKVMNEGFLPWLVLVHEKKALVSLVAFGSTRNVEQRLVHLELG